MKTKFTLLTIILGFTFSQLFSTVRTVSNDPAGGAQYSTLQAAYNAASSGDTLIIEGTNVAYYLFQILKPLVFIGIGFNPDKQNPRQTIISMPYGILGSASGSKLYGIVWLNPVNFETGPVNNIHFESCRFEQYFTFYGQGSNNTSFINCIFAGTSGPNIRTVSVSSVNSGVQIYNSVFNTYIDTDNNPYLTMTVDHCLFLSTTSGGFTEVSNATISNCIFMNFFPGGTTNSTFLNNLSRVAGTFPPAGTGNSGSGNIENTNPNFVNYTLNTLYSTAHDYSLQAGSAAIGTGTGATDIGVHGGNSGFSEFGEVLINPIVRSVTILNPLVAPNGTLQVDVHASSPHND